jgi:ceramide glucosyltransferase
LVVSSVITVILLLLLFAGSIYQLFALFCAREFFCRKEEDRAQQTACVPVSIIKPLKDREPGLADNLKSFCQLDYPEYEVLLGFSERDGRAAAETAREITDTRVRVIVSSRELGANRKVSNLQGLVEAARYPLLAISDGDMRADGSYLRDIVHEYQAAPDTGMVTCLYKIPAPRSLGAALESLTLALDFMPSVLVARRMEGVTFGLGASMLVSKKGLDDIGGLASIADYLADDYQLGHRLWKKGYRIVLSRVVLENVVGYMTVRDFAVHQLRWARTYRASRPKGFAGYGISFVFPFAVMMLILNGPTPLSLSILACVLLLRYAMAAFLYSAVIRTKVWLRWLPLVPLKDIAGFCIWFWSFMGNTVHWNGRPFRLTKTGRISRA